MIWRVWCTGVIYTDTTFSVCVCASARALIAQPIHRELITLFDWAITKKSVSPSQPAGGWRSLYLPFSSYPPISDEFLPMSFPCVWFSSSLPLSSTLSSYNLTIQHYFLPSSICFFISSRFFFFFSSPIKQSSIAFSITYNAAMGIIDQMINTTNFRHESARITTIKIIWINILQTVHQIRDIWTHLNAREKIRILSYLFNEVCLSGSVWLGYNRHTHLKCTKAHGSLFYLRWLPVRIECLLCND